METASDMENLAINILDLPEEILRQIFKFVPCRSDLSLVCSKFNEISCQTKNYQLTAKMLLDDNSDDLLKNSLRRFNSVYLSDLSSTETDDKPVLLLQKHIDLLKFVGENIRYLRIGAYYYKRDNQYIQIDTNLSSLLKLMPNLESIMLHGDVSFLKNEPNSQATLNLPKLKDLAILSYIGDLSIFNYLPNDILRIIKIDCSTTGKLNVDFSQLFNNQRRRLEKISISYCLFPFIDFNALSYVTKAYVVSNEPTDNLEPIFHGLKSLETLDLIIASYISSEQAKSFAIFQHLQMMSIIWLNNDEDPPVDMYSDCLNGLSSGTLKTLRLGSSEGEEPIIITAQTLKALSRNLPQLQHLELGYESPIEIINTIVGHFPNLKTLYLETSNDLSTQPGPYIFQDNLKNESLNNLKINGKGSMSKYIPKLLAACKNLKYFETTMQLNAEDIQAILTLEPNLNALCLLGRSPLVLSTNLVATLSAFGQNLKELSCFAVFGDGITEGFVRNYLKDKFKNIEFLMKKTDQQKFTLKLNNGFPKQGFPFFKF